MPQTGSSWPTILILHEGHFAAGSIYGGTVQMIASDLRDVGYLVFVGDYRLAPCGLIEGQTVHDQSTTEGRESGRPTQQKNDIKSLIAAARDDGRCNGWVGVLGGSSGATHAAWAAIDQTESTVWPVWNSDLRPDAVACLSGAYDFSDRSTPGNKQDAFIERVENYTNTCDRIEQRDESIVKLIEESPTNIKPILAINAENDTMPLPQLDDLRCALENRGVSSTLYQTLVIPDNSNHAFGYWYDWDGVNPVGNGPTLTVASHVNAFFAAHQ